MDPTLNIMLLGNAGVGKSASGNTILGKIGFESKNSFDPVTTAISEVSGQVLDKRINVIDTPGILESEEIKEEIKTRCQQLIEADTPRLFLVVVKIDRFTTEQKTAVEAAITVIGEEELRNAYMLFTNGDALNMTLDEFINQRPDGPLPQLVRRFKGMHQFNNENGGYDQVKELLQNVGHPRSAFAEQNIVKRFRESGETSVCKGQGQKPLLDATKINTATWAQEELGKPFSLSTVHGCIQKDRPRYERKTVLLGLPGDGKSASGNTILGSDRFHSGCSFGVVTMESKLESAQVEDRHVKVIDTPGFTQESLTPRDLYREIVKGIEAAHPGPHAFVIVVRIGRISEAHLKLFEMLPKLFGKDAPKYTVILFTYGDELRGQSIEEMIQTETSLTKLHVLKRFEWSARLEKRCTSTSPFTI